MAVKIGEVVKVAEIDTERRSIPLSIGTEEREREKKTSNSAAGDDDDDDVAFDCFVVSRARARSTGTGLKVLISFR